MLGQKRGIHEQRNCSIILSTTHSRAHGRLNTLAEASSIKRGQDLPQAFEWEQTWKSIPAAGFFHYQTQIVEILQLFFGAGDLVTRARLGTDDKTQLKKLLCNFMRLVPFFSNKGFSRACAPAAFRPHYSYRRIQTAAKPWRNKAGSRRVSKPVQTTGTVGRDTHNGDTLVHSRKTSTVLSQTDD